MKIEYIYPNSDEEKSISAQIKQMQKENTIGCLVAALVLISGLFILLALLPIILTVLAWSILFISAYIIYKAYLEEYVFNIIARLKNHRR